MFNSIDQVRADIDGDGVTLRANGSTLAFPGFRRLYEEGRDEPAADAEEKLLPPLGEGDAVTATALEPVPTSSARVTSPLAASRLVTVPSRPAT